jgi:hypothetical protein
LPLGGGIWATYHDGSVSSIQVQPSISISWPTTPHHVEFSGYVLPPVSGTYHFRISTGGSARLWIQRRLVLDFWKSNFQSKNQFLEIRSHSAKVEVSSSICCMYFSLNLCLTVVWRQLMANTIQEIRISFRARGDKKIRFTWSSPNFDEISVQSEFLCYSGAHILGSPFRLHVLPGPPSPQTIQLVDFPTQVVVGERFSALLWAGDSFNNSVSGMSSQLVLTLQAPKEFASRSVVISVQDNIPLQDNSGHNQELCSRSSVKAIQDTIPMGYKGVFPATTKIGTHSMFASLALVGGLSATYFSSAEFMVPVSSRQDIVDFSESAGEHRLSTPKIYESSSIRWVGFIRPEHSDVYSLMAKQISKSERVRLWIDETLIVDQWSSLAGIQNLGTIYFPFANSFFHISVEYKQTNKSAFSSLQLLWSSTNVTYYVIPSYMLAEALPVQGSPQSIAVRGGNVSALHSSFFGSCASLATAGSSCLFTLRFRDSFGTSTALQGELEVSSLNVQSGSTIVTNCNDSFGKRECNFVVTPVSEGSTILSVMYRSDLSTFPVHVHGSPSTIKILPRRSGAYEIVALGSGLTLATAGSKIKFLSVLVNCVLR